MKMPSQAVLIGGGVVLVALAAFWLTRKGNAASLGASVGGAAVDLVTGAATGAAEAVATAANNPDINPLEPAGAWLGGTLYDWTHSKEAGGVW